MSKQNETAQIHDEYLDNTSDCLHNLNGLQYELKELSQAFNLTGNIEMARTLGQIADEILINTDTIRNAIGKECNRQYKESETQLHDTLKVVMTHLLKPRVAIIPIDKS
jgi:hypothetical protein